MASRRILIAADSHGTHLDPRCEEAILAHIADFKPEVRVHLGDAWDLAALRMGASDAERETSIKEDFGAAESFLKRFFRGGRDNFYLEGNHDRVRLEGAAQSRNAIIREAAEDGIANMDRILRQCRAKVLPYDARHGVLQLGHLRMIHGYAHGVGAVAKTARVYGNVLMGHIHCISAVPVESLHGPAECRSIGALCVLDQPYNARQMNKLRHDQGWAYGYLHDDGTYTLFQTRRINDSFHACSEIQEY